MKIKLLKSALLLLSLSAFASASAQTPSAAGKMRLEGKIALITGAGSGMGQAMATLFSDEGATVVVVDINRERGESTVRTINDRAGRSMFIQADVRRNEDIERMIQQTLRAFGRLDILVNNAGVFDMGVPVGDLSDELWEKVMDINLNAPMRTIRRVLPVFEAQGGGVILNMASVAGYTGARGGGAAYVASKHGVVGLTKNVAFNYKEKNIRCNAIAPGRIMTSIRDNSQEVVGSMDAYNATIDDWREIEQQVQAGYDTNLRRAQPMEIAYVALFLVSDEASFVNGSIYTADGAWTSY